MIEPSLQAFVTGLKAAFPDSGFEYLATSLPDTALDPAYTYLDFHQYNTPEWFIERALQYDTYPRNGTHLFIGEYVLLRIKLWRNVLTSPKICRDVDKFLVPSRRIFLR
jgi:hypothetical protein